MRTSYRFLIFLLVAVTIILSTYASQSLLIGKTIEERANVTKVIDGDTIEVNMQGASYKVRFLDINTPEKNRPYYMEAMNFLKEKIEGKEVSLEKGKENKDKYQRLLRYVLLNDQLINEEILKQGYANFYSYKDSRYTRRLKEAEQLAREGGRGIWEKSQHACSSCISLEEVENGEGKEDCQSGNEWITFLNHCSQVCILDGWTIKDDASHIYTFKEIILQENQEIILNSGQGEDTQKNKIILFFQNKDKCASIWNDDQDSLFLRDAEGKLVIYHHYE